MSPKNPMVSTKTHRFQELGVRIWTLARICPRCRLGNRIEQIHQTNTLQGINISHLGKRKVIFKVPFLGDMLIPWRVPM